MPEVTPFAQRQLAATDEVVEMVGASESWPVWVFQWRLREKVEGTGGRGVVLSRPRPWAIPNAWNTAEFPQLQVDVYADVTRDTDGRALKDDAEARALELSAVIRRVLHVPQGGQMSWGNDDGTVRVVSSVAGADPQIIRVPGTEVARATSTYEVTLG